MCDPRNQKPTSLSRAAVVAMVTVLATMAPAAGTKPGPKAIVTIETRDLKVEFAGDRAWTMHRIFHQGELVADKVGFYGSVFSPEGGNWIGTGHTEGGVEEVVSVSLTVDGKSCALTPSAVYQGRRAEIRKHSRLGPLRLEATYIVTDDALLERHRYEATAAVGINRLYAFMHPWLPRTTEWMAEKLDGSILSGKFESDGSFKPKEDVRWTALFDPVSRRAMLTWFPTPVAGHELKTAYWDHKAYHKLYTQLYSHAQLAPGAKFEASVVIRGIKAEAATWQESARKLAIETQQRFPAGSGFAPAPAP